MEVAAPGVPKEVTEKDYEFRDFVNNVQRVQFFRFRASTGEGWILISDQPDSKWSKFDEPKAPPKGQYEFTVTGKNSPIIFRFDRTNGATWRIVDKAWQKVEDAKAK